jgi:hypothetical protein
MSYISKKSLEKAKELLGKDKETCGHIIDTEIVFDIKGSGPKMCIQHKYTPYIWHTHIESRIAYPTGEDVVKMIKKRVNPIVSIIFSSWGIWEITVKNKYDLLPQNVEEIIKKINKYYSKLYFISEKGRIFKPELLEEILNINNHISRQFEIFGLKILFTPWELIGNKYIFY